MSDEKAPGAKKAKSGRAIGGFASQWGSFGSENGEDESTSAVQTSEYSTTQNATISAVQTSRLPESENATMPAVQTSSTSDTRKSKHPEWKQKTVYLPPDLTKWLNVHAAQAELEISEIVALALREYKERHP